MKKISLLFVVMIVFVAYSCGPSVEGETKNWDRNIKALKKMQVDYPAYAELITGKITEAEVIYEKAKGISDEEEKAQNMRKANSVLNSGCVGDLKKMSSKIDGVEKKKNELKKKIKNKTASDLKYAEFVIDDAKTAIKKAEKVLNKKSEDLDGNPCLKIEKAYKNLETAYKDIEEAIASFKDQERKKEEELKKETEKKEEAAKMIECTYCGSKNEAGSTKCKSCGANL